VYDDNHRRHTIFYNFWLSCMAVAAHTLDRSMLLNEEK